IEFDNVTEPFVVNMRVNAGFIPKDHGAPMPTVGGGRIIGDICNSVDLIQVFTGSVPVKLVAASIATSNETLTSHDNIAIVLKFSNGSVGNITYVANGDKSMPKEYIEVFAAGNIGVIHDFNSGAFHKGGKVRKLKSNGKGH